MSRQKYKINWKRFALFILAAVLVIGLVACGVSKLFGSRDGGQNSKQPDPEKCRHVFENGVCTKCGYVCAHEYKDGKCSICGAEQDPRLLWPNTSTAKENYPLTGASEDWLVLVNKQYHLTESYVPEDLVAVDRYVEGVGDVSQKTNCMRRVAADALEKMFDAAAAEGIDLKLRTGYRSYTYQVGLFNSYAANHGEEEANKYSARAGESEHQTGLACDLGAASQGYALSDYFGDTPEGEWVRNNCWKYGFILRYIDGTLEKAGEHTGYIYEAWHIRYVGKEAAAIICEHGWTLEEYLEEIAKAQ